MSEAMQPVRHGPVSATDAAFAGFGLLRRRPALFGGLIVVSLMFYLLMLWVQFAWLMPPFLRMAQEQRAAAAAGSPPDPSVTLAMLSRIWPAQFLILFASAAFGAVTNAAVFRAVLRPAEPAFLGLRLGADELRQFGLFLAFFLLFIGLYIASAILAVLVAVVAALVLHAGAGGGGWGRAAVVLAVIACVLLPMLIAMVRLALAGPLTFARRSVQLFASWRLTRDRFWTVFGTYVLAFFVMVIVSLVFFVVAAVLALIFGGGLHALAPDPQTLATTGFVFSPMLLIWAILNAPLAALWYAVFGGVAASLYLQIAGGPDPAFASPDRSHAFGAQPAPTPVPPPPDTEYPIIPPRAPPPPDAP